ncbi:DME family drug/metabolite transporter [Neobacillus niacini]|jgi:drug/metabolite transporter, DME family|uniref:EamA family transporter n=1 Tax=Neobacillus niacini TaxID=86668 RepID=UPI002780F873|nr:EamA family transporter [Neobacillus niacini]MDQ1002792.1 DME family drug/metabolite transporter [Neobacillus niacini]
MKGKLPSFLILLAAILWGTTGTTQALAPETAHPIAIGATRLAVGGLFLLLMVLVIGKFNFQGWAIKTTLMASLCMALYQPLFFSAVSITGVAIGTVVAIGSAPIFSGLIEWIYLKIRPSKIWWYSTFLSILGCLMLFVNKESVFVDPIGILMALGAGLSFASYTLISRTLVEKHSSLSVVAVVFTLSAICLSPILFVFDMSWIMSFNGVGVSLQLGIMATGIAYFLFGKGLIHVSSSTAVTLSLAEPLTAALLGVFILGEYLTITSWFGIILLMLGIGILLWSSKKSPSKKELRMVQ